MLHTSLTAGLSSSRVPYIRSTVGPNEFEVPPRDHLAVKFLKQIYEQPLIIMLLGSAGVSAVMGTVDDAVSIALAIIIVLTGAWPDLEPTPLVADCVHLQ